MTKLALRRCTPIKKGSKPISPGIARSLLNQINNKWRLDPQAKFIERDFEFADFRRAIEFVNAVAWVANGQDHHPDLEISYNRCKLRFSTHTAGGLTVNDFICAAKVDALFSEERLKSASAPAAKSQHPASSVAVAESSSAENQEVATDGVQLSELSLDSKEVEELLNKRLSDEEDETTAQDATNEFELIDPETIRPPEPPQETPASAQKEQQQAPASAAQEKPAISKESHAELDLTSTVILPPGMQVVGKTPDDEEEDATVILPENTAIDPDETVVGVPPPPVSETKDNDEVRTVIMNPTVTAETGEETVIRSSASRVSSKSGNHQPSVTSVSLPPISPKTDEDEVGTMILSSNPFNRPEPTWASSKTGNTENTNQQSNAGEKQQAAGTPSKPATGEKEPDPMGTMILSAAEIEAMKQGQPEKKQAPPKKANEDDTLVMHVNDFKKMKNDQQ